MKLRELVQPQSQAINEAIAWHLRSQTPILENVFRHSSPAWFEFFRELRKAVAEGQVQLSSDLDKDVIASDLGEFGMYEGRQVPLDCIFEEPQQPLEEAEYKGKTVELNKPRRGGAKKYYVYVKNPKTGNVKKVQFGDVSGLSVKIRDPKRRKAFASRHNCEKKTNKLSAGYWACRVPAHAKSLGLAPIHARWW